MVKPTFTTSSRLFTRHDVERLLDLDACLHAVEEGFRLLGTGPASPSGVLALRLSAGGFHAKAAVQAAGQAGRPYLAAKLNLNLPGNPAALGLPTIQGVLALFDAVTGTPVAVMDSTAITVLRTAAATGVAAKHLANPDASTVTIIGCGAQAAAQLAALARVCSLGKGFAFDLDLGAAEQFATNAARQIGIRMEAVQDLVAATRMSDIVVTCTPASRAFLGPEHMRRGTFVAAVGADSEHKSEIVPELMVAAAIVTDQRDQCAAIGDWHHAIEAGLMTMDGTRADLADVVSGRVNGRRDREEIVIFDSTGLPFQDVVAAALVYERGLEQGVGLSFDFRD